MNKKFLYYITICLLICISLVLFTSCKEPEPINPHECYYEQQVVQPTCTEKGYTLNFCQCGNSYQSDETELLGHNLNEEVSEEYLKKEADCINLAVYYKSCTRCGFVSQEEFTHGDLSGHVFGESLSDKDFGEYNLCTVCNIRKGQLPIININTLTGEKIETKEYVDTKISISNCAEEYVLENVDAEVKVRGNATSRQPKKPFRIKFNKKQKMLGLNNDLKAKSWVLLAEYWDKSFSRNMVALSLANQFLNSDGYYASDYTLVEVYINGVYNGIYGLAEQQQVNEGRININEPEENYDGIDIGYLIEYDSYAETEDYYFAVDYKHDLITYANEICPKNKFNNLYTIKSDIYSNEQVEFISKYIQNVYDVIYDAIHNETSGFIYKTLDSNGDIIDDPTITSAKEAVERLIDLDSLAKAYILHETIMNIDYGWSSFFMSLDMSVDGNKKLTFEAPWDFDWSLTCHFNKLEEVYLCNLNQNFHTASLYVNPWLMIFCHEEWFWDVVKTNYYEFRDSGVVESTSEKVLAIGRSFEFNFEQNFELWPDSVKTIIYNSPEFIECPTQKESSALVIEWLNKRIEFLDRWWNYQNNL